MKQELGGDPDLVKQALADLNASQRQEQRNNFEARQEYTKQVAVIKGIVDEGIREYGLQTLRWIFLLNAGAIGVVLAYVGAVAKSSSISLTNFPPVVINLWPFALGCFFVVLAGAAGYFNFMYAKGALPAPEHLHNFSAPHERYWPAAMMQRPGETPEDFYKRFVRRKITSAQNIAVAFTVAAVLCFALGVGIMFRVAWTEPQVALTDRAQAVTEPRAQSPAAAVTEPRNQAAEPRAQAAVTEPRADPVDTTTKKRCKVVHGRRTCTARARP
jgi:hypothetical protein